LCILLCKGGIIITKIIKGCEKMSKQSNQRYRKEVLKDKNMKSSVNNQNEKNSVTEGRKENHGNTEAK